MKGTATSVTTEQIRLGFQKTFNVVQELKQEAGTGHEVSTFNMMVTDGHRIFGTRFSSNPEKETRTLYFSSGSRFRCENGVSNMLKDESGDKAVLIASEKLNDHKEEWTSIPPNHFIAVENSMETSLHPLECH